MIEIRGLSFRYAGESRDALRNIDMTVEDGDFIGVDRAEIPRRIDEALGDVGIAPLRHRAIDSLSGIMEAQTARGVAFDTKNPFKKLGLILPLCMPLLISSVGRIHDTAAAAEMRGFTLRTRESQSRRYTFKSGDLFAALIAAALVAAGALL